MSITQATVADARAFALAAHGDQSDKLGVPYGAHLAHVASQLARFGREFEITGWLHDVIEDTGVGLDEIEARFGPVIAQAVDAMTRREGEIYFQQYLPRVLTNQIAMHCKYADSRHNIGKAHLLTDKKQQSSLVKKYSRVLDTIEAADPRLKRWGDWQDLVFDGAKWSPKG
jgi:guanosine-3',5'-bis(diphosphate) 3'-pyrophosphohydrolase